MKKICLACFLLTLIVSSNLAGAQDNPPAFQLTHQIGRGHIQSIEWHPTKDVILVSTIRGAWFYDAALHDLGHIEDARLAVFSPDGATVAGVDADNRITLWNSDTYASAGSMTGDETLVTALEWSPDGTLLATADQSGLVKIWDVNQETLHTQWQAEGTIKLLHWSLHGTYLAVLTADSIIQVWDVQADEIVFELHLDFGTLDIVWIDDTHLARSTEMEGDPVTIWNVQSGEQIFGQYYGDFPPLSIHMYWGGLASLSNDATLLATTYRWLDPRALAPIYIKHIKNGESPYTFSGETELSGNYFMVENIAWNATDTLLASGGNYGDIKVWNTETGALIASNEAHTQSTPNRPYWLGFMNPTIYGLPAWSPDSRMIAVPDNLNTVDIWNITTSQLVSSLSEHGIRVVQIAWQPGGELIATSTEWWMQEAYDPVTRIWNARSGSLIDQYKNADPAIAWRPDGSILVGVMEANTLSVWHAATQQLGSPLTITDLSRIDFAEQFVPNGLGWTVDGNSLLAYYRANLSRRVTTYKYPSLNPISVVSNHSHSMSCPQVAWNADGSRQYVARWPCPPPNIEVTDAEYVINLETYSLDSQAIPSYDPISTMQLFGHTGLIDQVAWNSDGEYLVSTSEDGTSRLWQNNVEPSSVILPHLKNVRWSPDSRFFAGFNEDDQSWLILDRATQDIIQTIPALEWDRGYIVWSPDSQKIAQVVDGVVFIWER